MALETLKDVKEIDGFYVEHEDLDYYLAMGDYHLKKECPIVIDTEENILLFKIQSGPVKEVGVNGCQVDTLIAASIRIVEGLHRNYPCKENEKILDFLYLAYNGLKLRKAEREKRGVEGYNKA